IVPPRPLKGEGEQQYTDELLAPVKRGTLLRLDQAPGDEEKEKSTYPWRVPRSARTVEAVSPPEGTPVEGLLVTPSAVEAERLDSPALRGWAVTDRTDQSIENLRTTVFRVDPSYTLWESANQESAEQIGRLSRAIMAASLAVLLLIAASMI